MMGSSGPGNGPRYLLHPPLVYDLVIRCKPYDLIGYLDSIPGASEDPHCLQIRDVVDTLLTHIRSGLFDEALLKEFGLSAWSYATESRLCRLQMGGGPSNLPPDAEFGHAPMSNQSSASNPRNHTATLHPLQANSTDVMIETSAFNSRTHASATIPWLNNSKIELRDAVMDNQLSDSYSRNHTATFPRPQLNSNDGHNMHPHNSSSYPGRMLTMKPGSNDAAKFSVPMHNQLSASYSRNHTATFPRPQLNSNEGHNVHPHNSSSYSGRMLTKEPSSNEVRDAAMHNQLSGSNSRNHTVTSPPVQANSNDVHAFSPQKHGTRAVGPLWLRYPGSEQSNQQMLMQNRKVLPTVDIKGKRPASEVDQIKVPMLRLNVASFVTEDGLNSCAGVLIRNEITGQFICASCFSPILRTEPALLFAAACCRGIKIAVSYEPATILLESHLLHLLYPLYASPDQPPDLVQLREFLSQPHPHFTVENIPEISNRAACRLAYNVLGMKESYMFFNDLPEWLIPYLD